MVPAERKVSVMGRVVDFGAPAIDVWVCLCGLGAGSDGGGS